MRARDFLTEYRDKMFQYVKSVLPKWPDYVLRDWIYNLARGEHRAGPGYDPQNPNWKFNRETILKMVAEAGLSPDTQWTLNPRKQFTMDMWEPKTRQRLIGRAGGTSDLGMGIPRDKERHATQAALAQQQGGVRKEPVILIKTSQGYELAEGWHRTIQHFAMYPQGYTGPAYVAVAQGVAEGFAVENRMSAINVATAIQNTPPAWQQWIATLPQQLAQEFIDERPSPDATDIQEYTKLKLASPQPRVVNVADLLKNPRNQYMIGLAPDDVVADINQKWGLQIASGKKYEPTPGRHRETAKLSGATAAPSVMINGVITFGVGRFTAACLRGDRTMSVWDLRG